MARDKLKTPLSTEDFPAWYEKFGRKQRTSLALVATGCLLIVVLGQWLYAVGLTLGFFMGYAFSRSRRHAEMAKAMFDFAGFLEHLDAQWRVEVAEEVARQVESMVDDANAGRAKGASSED